MNYDVDTDKKLARKKGMILKQEWKVGELANFVEYVVTELR